VPVKAPEGALPNECFENVRLQVAAHGGGIRYGWMLWEWPAILLEAEFHAVWANPQGSLLDVTPKVDGEKQILFLPNSTRIYENKYVDNVRMALRDDRDVREFIQVVEEIGRIRARYTVNGLAEVPAEEVLPLEQRKMQLIARLQPRPPARPDGRVGRNDPCPCGSGKKFKKCHGARRVV
jgi:hypothetical protein